MADRLSVTWDGRQFEIERVEAREAEAGPGPVWRVLRDGAPVTTFPAGPGDTDAAVREKVLAWLRGNESRPAQDVGRQ